MIFNRRLTVLSLCMALLPAAGMAQTKIKMVLKRQMIAHLSFTWKNPSLRF